MTVDTIRKGSSQDLKLFRSGTIRTTLNFNIPADTYYPVANIPLAGLDSNKLTILVYGHYTYPNGSPNPTQDYIVQAGVGGIASVIETPGGSPSRTVDGAFQLTDNNLAICIVNSFPHTTMTPVAPFAVASITYFVFYY